LERQDWRQAERLMVSETPFPYSDAVPWFARGVGAARLGHVAAANDEVMALKHIRSRHIVMHPFILGELACGNFSNREVTLELLQQLHSATVAEHDEVMTFLRAQKLYGRGVGYVDVHLLAAAAIE
jgi:hypothetical protein